MSTSCGSCDMVSSMVAVRQANIQASASMKAAKLVLDTQRDQGSQVVAQLLESAQVQQKAILDAAGRLNAVA